ncbi:MAG: GNAT family N-acetyltransferase [Clostridiales bacterium]|nr:GNAT family N-acetyltransferase [Clostridiales bacterium]
MIRKAKEKDIDAVVEIYSKIFEKEAKAGTTTGWKPEVYPTENTARESFLKDELFVMETEGKIIAAARLNHEQEDDYVRGNWQLEAPKEKILVMHTLVVDPEASGRGYATQFVADYEAYAREKGCLSLRMDTNAINKPARSLYKKLGFSEVGIIDCTFNGLEDIRLVCLEKVLN